MPAGRPLKFETVEELQRMIDSYFDNTPEDEWTITGLALALDTYRQTLINYEGKEDFMDTIKKAKQIVENGYEKDLKKHGRTGTIFALKNFDWKDKTETDITSAGKALSSITSEDTAIAQELNKLKQNGNNSATSEPSERSIAGAMGGEVSNQE